MHETILQVTGMTCNHCVMRVTEALQKTPGVNSAQVDLAKGEAVVRGNADAMVMIASVKAAGYGADLKR